jgi:transcriptional activator SPT7
MASRGRKAPSKVAKKGSSTSRKAPPSINEGTPAPESKDSKPNAVSGQGLRNNFLRADSDAPMEGIINGFSTPPPPGGNLTPLGINGVMPSGASQTDASDAEGPGFSANDLTQADEPEYADLEFRTWKQVTKRLELLLPPREIDFS